MQEIGVF